MKTYLYSQGQSLAEIVVAIGVVALLVTGVVVATTSSLRNSQAGRVRSLAVQFAQEGVELTRNLRNDGWSGFQTYSGLWCLDKSGVWAQAEAGACPVNIDNIFTRGVTFSWDEVNQRMSVAVSVRWMESDNERETKIETIMTDWQ